MKGRGKKKKKKKKKRHTLVPSTSQANPFPFSARMVRKIWINKQTGLQNLISSVGRSISSCLI